MLCGGHQDKGGEEEGLPFSITYCWNKGKEHLDSLRNDFLNGQVLMVLTAHKPRGCPPVVMNSWEDKLKTLGREVTEDQWETLIQRTVLEPEMRTYLSYNSRGIRMGIAASWKVNVLVTFVALVAAVAILVIIHHDQSKMNVNTDMRLMAANEAFMKLGFLLALKRNLEDVSIVVEAAVLPTWESQLNDPLEESSLLPETKKKGIKNFLSRREFLCLVPDRTPETMAQQLLMVFSSYYVRLLVSGQLPEVHAGQHKTMGHRPCLCQFVKTALLGEESSGFQQ
ncbi:hypothetical protein E2320_006534, partial [Naja naja]